MTCVVSFLDMAVCIDLVDLQLQILTTAAITIVTLVRFFML